MILPKIETDNIGNVLENCLGAVRKSYIDVFPDRKFNNYRVGELSNQVFITEGSRHDYLINRMKQGPVIAIHFPNSLQGFSINASRKQMATLPEGFILSGLDTVIAMAMYPDVLARDWYTPGYDLAALLWRSPGCSLHFWAGDGRLSFDVGGALGGACGDYFSSGLLFLGSA